MKKTKLLVLWSIALYVGFSLTGCSDDEINKVEVIEDSKPTEPVSPKGFFVVNEDWFGHDNGTVNYFKKSGDTYKASYRIYRAANNNEQFGVTTQFATVWGENAYFVSKQRNRLVVADAKSMKKKIVIENLGGDGRSFLGINCTKGYVGHANGITIFDIADLKVTAQLESVSGQMGSMCLSAGKVFAISQKNGVYVINAETDKVEKNIEGSYNTLTCSKDGNVWIAAKNRLIKIDPVTLEQTEIAYPEGVSVGSSWGAWNAGSFCASTQNNVLYWASGNKVINYDIDKNVFNTALYTLGKSEENTQLAFYGAGLRVDPFSDELILTVKHSGWGASGAYNWIYKLNSSGQEVIHFAVKGDNGSGASWGGNEEEWDGKYFWFPAMPFFEDANEPQILLNQILLKVGETKVIDLNEKIVDYDNSVVSIQKSVKIVNNQLVETTLAGNKLTIKASNTPGSTTCTITAISNGIKVEKEVLVDIEKL